jgi:hypothetical protein
MRPPPLPRYFFHITHEPSVEDAAGLDLPDREAAWTKPRCRKSMASCPLGSSGGWKYTVKTVRFSNQLRGRDVATIDKE